MNFAHFSPFLETAVSGCTYFLLRYSLVSFLSEYSKSENFTLFISIPFSVIFPKSFLFLITSFGFSGTNSGQ